MTLVTILLCVIIVLQLVILRDITASMRTQIEVTKKTSESLAKGLDWIDGGLENSLEDYRGYGS